jgi:hypothetical protein
MGAAGGLGALGWGRGAGSLTVSESRAFWFAGRCGSADREEPWRHLNKSIWGIVSISIIARRPTGGWPCVVGAGSSPTDRREITLLGSESWCARHSGSTPRRGSVASQERRTASTGSGASLGDVQRRNPCSRRRAARVSHATPTALGTALSVHAAVMSPTPAVYAPSVSLSVAGTAETERRCGQHARSGPTARRVAGDHKMGPTTVPADLTDRLGGGPGSLLVPV